MSQALDPTGRVLHKMNQNGAMSGGAESTEARYVCPFCGNVNDNREGACPRCSMENTPLTRQATRARIGPWSVLQTRNPSAPGMKYSTLLSLVKKGQVTPRSIVRGPTTHQLWRFASKVKGLSREFGLCWGCGQEIDHTTSTCPHCQRSQEPPAAPDTLVEGRTPVAASLPVRREIRPEFKNPVQLAEPTRADIRPAIEPVRAEVPRREVLPVMESPLIAGIAPEMVPPAAQTAAERRAALEAVALREGGLPFPGPAHSRLQRSRTGRVLLVLGTMAVIMVGGWLYVDEASRSSVMGWLHINTTPKPVEQVVTPEAGTPGQTAPRPTARSFDEISLPPLPSRPGNSTASSGSNSTAGNGGTQAATPSPATPPRRVSPPAVPTPAPSAVASSDNLADANIEKSRALWRSALDAEMRNDPASALKFMEEIQRLPAAAWPGGLNLHMQAAKDKLAAGGN